MKKFEEAKENIITGLLDNKGISINTKEMIKLDNLTPEPIRLEWFHDRGFTYAKLSKYCHHYKLDLRNMKILIYKDSLVECFEVIKCENDYDPQFTITPIAYLKDRAQQHFNEFVKGLIQ